MQPTTNIKQSLKSISILLLFVFQLMVVSVIHPLLHHCNNCHTETNAPKSEISDTCPFCYAGVSHDYAVAQADTHFIEISKPLVFVETAYLFLSHTFTCKSSRAPPVPVI